MSKVEVKVNPGGIGFTGLLQIVFITLKLLEKIDWSWWWILSPAIVSAIIFCMGLLLLICLEILERLLK